MNIRLIYTIIVALFCTTEVIGQDRALLDQLQKEEQKTIEAIALYPEEERMAILTAATHPEIIVRLDNMQKKTSEEFRDLINYLDEEDQKKVFDVARYPELIEDLTSSGRKKKKKELDELLKNYPEEIQEKATYLNNRHYKLLEEVGRQRNNSDLAFERVISSYPADVQNAFRKLIKLPEVMGILSDNLNMTVLLGDMYKSKPAQLISELDSLNVTVAEQKAKELNDWKRTLEEDPQALTEYEEAARKFAREQGYDETEYLSSAPDQRTTQVYIYAVSRPYDYWFGCPWWYPYDCWYPYPYWYHWGFYYGPAQSIVFVGLPSSYFVYWHFYYGSNLYYYPHFTNCVFNYHYSYPYTQTNITVVTNNWIRRERPNLPNNWFRDDARRVDRIKEYGKFKMDYASLTRDGGENLTQREFLERRPNDYPTLKPVLKERSAPVQRTETDRGVERQIDRPIERRDTPMRNQEPRVIERPQTRRQEIDRAKDHHENTWSRPQPKVQPQPRQRPQVQPRPQPNPRVTPVPRQPTPRSRNPR